MNGETLHLERTFRAGAERVFDAWTSEEVMRRWFYGQPDWENSGAEVDLRVDGAVRVSMRDPSDGKEYGGGGVYREVDRPRRLVFTWTWDDEDRETLIEIDFEEVDDGTRVSFTHRNLVDEEAVRSHESGWTTCLDNLERVLA